MRDNRGFTIIEIMIVVAILAILAGVSIPQYKRMVDKGNQQGAVVGLTSIYIAQKNFAAENHTYTSCLGAIGITKPGGPRWYTFGFKADNLAASCGQTGDQACNYGAWDEGSPLSPCLANTSDSDHMLADRRGDTQNPTPLPTAVHLATLNTDMTATTFKARAVGNLNSLSGYDRWSIDQNGTPTNDKQLF